MNLFFRQSGEGPPLIILHGLFGSSDNWYTLSKVFAQRFNVFVVDQRNHGQSPHSPEHNYRLLTEDLEAFILANNIQTPILIGHSMGGKTAMNFAIKNPAAVRKLIVVDMMPKPYPVHHDSILEGMKALDLAALTSRNEADQILTTYVGEASVRQFLLKNLSRNEQGGFEWKINLRALDANIEAMGEGLQYKGRFEGPTLFVKGAKSNYYAPGDESVVSSYFPNAKWVTLDTGHWVQAEQPTQFSEAVLAFIAS